MEKVLRFEGALKHDPAIDAWLKQQPGELGAIACKWFAKFRACSDEVLELMHDGCPVVCFGDVPFGYVNVFRAHVNIGFFLGADLSDPKRLLEGAGKRMRHVKVKPGEELDSAALSTLMMAAFDDVRSRV